ncbi:hypothetical protein D6D06_05274 [Aureobasidium pullulans]|nr:hypothetical protein D6D06_05274 [Aureobasidium pullulans]
MRDNSNFLGTICKATEYSCSRTPSYMISCSLYKQKGWHKKAKESILGSPQSPVVWTDLTRPNGLRPQSQLRLSFSPPHTTALWNLVKGLGTFFPTIVFSYLDHIAQLARHWNTNNRSKILVFVINGSEVTKLPTEAFGKEPKPVLLRLNESRWEAACHFGVLAEQLSGTTKPEPESAENLVKQTVSTVAATSERPRGELQDNTNDTAKPDSTQQAPTATENPDELVVDNIRNAISKLSLAVVNLSEAAMNMNFPRREAIQPSINALYTDLRKVTKDGLVALDAVISDAAKDDDHSSDEGIVAKQDADNAAYQAADRDDSESDSDFRVKDVDMTRARMYQRFTQALHIN